MREELLNQAITKILEMITATGDFVMEQAPEVIRQMITFAIIGNGLVIIGSIFASACILICTHILSKSTDDDYFYVFNIFQIFPLIGIFCGSYKLLMAIVAPKVYLLHHITDLINR